MHLRSIGRVQNKHTKTNTQTIPSKHCALFQFLLMSVSSGSGADVDMRVSSKRGFVDVESAPSWVSAFIERMDQRLDTNERRIEQVLGLHQVRLDKHDEELSALRRLVEDQGSKIDDVRRIGTEPVVSSMSCPRNLVYCGLNKFLGAGEWCPRTVLVRGWAPLGAPASQKIDRV